MRVNISNKRLQQIIKESINKCLLEAKNNSFIYNITFVSYGTNSFDRDRFKAPKMDDMLNKPHGGFWGSPLNSSNGWGKWCDSEDFNLDSLDKHLLFKIKKGANIYIIDTKEDLDRISSNKNMIGGAFNMKTINFEYLYRNYDGIFVTSNAISELRHVSDGVGLYTWDVESICVFNPDVIEVIEENAFEKATIPTFEEPDTEEEREYHFDLEERDRIKKQKQINKAYELYGNQNINANSSSLFNGEHPGILAQGHGNNKKTKLARKYNGTIKSGM